MKKSQITAMCDADVHAYFNENFTNKKQGAEMVLSAFPMLRNITLRELKGKFTREELIAIVDSYNGTMMEPAYMCSNTYLKAQMEDSKEYENMDQRHGLTDWDGFLNKISQLTAMQTFTLLIEVHRFWNIDKAYGSPTPELERFLSLFV